MWLKIDLSLLTDFDVSLIFIIFMKMENNRQSKYSPKDIEKIFNYTTWTLKKKIDNLLEIDCNQYCNLGKESSVKKRNEVKQISKQIYRTIKLLDEPVGKQLLQAMD